MPKTKLGSCFCLKNNIIQVNLKSNFKFTWIKGGNPSIGASWEGYVIEQIMREAPEFSDFYYYRTQNGAEVDLLMMTPNGKMACIEVKFSVTPTISKGFYQSVEDLQPDFKYVITPSGERFDRVGGLRICPLNIFLEQELHALD